MASTNQDALAGQLGAIGDAIRGKTGKADPIALRDMAAAIEGIETGRACFPVTCSNPYREGTHGSGAVQTFALAITFDSPLPDSNYRVLLPTGGGAYTDMSANTSYKVTRDINGFDINYDPPKAMPTSVTFSNVRSKTTTGFQITCQIDKYYRVPANAASVTLNVVDYVIQ